MLLLLILAICLPASLALHCPPKCDCATGDELEYFCSAGGKNITFNGRNKEYVNIKCEGAYFRCEDLPVLNFGNNLPLPSLGLKGCHPDILTCIQRVLQTPSVNFITLTNSTDILTARNVEQLGDVQNLMIIKGADRTIPVQVLNSLTSLRTVRITGIPLTLNSDYSFSNSSRLEYLELSADQISKVPADAFSGLASLRTLNMWGNNFTDIGVDSFRGLDSLVHLYLNTNHLTNMAAGSLAHVPQLRSISLQRNPFQELPPGLLYNLTQLENVTIQNNQVKLLLHPHSFSNLPSLKILKIEDSSIDLPEDLLAGCDALQVLSLSRNQITSLPTSLLKDLKALERLDLSYNKISAVDSGVFSSLKKLQYLNLNRNYLQVLPDFLFSGLRKLNYVTINDNSLTTIAPLAFQGATDLNTLSLTSNQLTLKSSDHFGNGYVNFDEYSPFNTLVELEHLYLDTNLIDTMFADWRIALTKLKTLSLKWNAFTILDATDCQFLSENVTVNLRGNHITTVSLNYASLPPNRTAIDTKPQTNSIILNANPLTCDCGLFNLAMRLRGARPITAEPRFVVDSARCNFPVHLEGLLFKDVSLNDLTCDLPPEYCNDSCTSCVLRPGMNDLAFDCISTPPSLPTPEDFALKYLSLKLKTPPNDISDLNLLILNLTDIGLTEIPFEPSKTVETIDFSNNGLTRIPIQFLESNISLYLSNNPFECECWYSDEISTLQKSALVKDLERVTCKNGDRLVQVDVVALCSTWRAAAVASGTFMVLVLIVTISAITIYKYSREILIFIIDKGLFPCCFIEDPDSSNKKYDVFISYAHKDREYLSTLLPKLENEFGLKTCVHYRDWCIGDFIPDQINKSVENSRRTVILLSNNFLSSAYANMEFRAAHNLALKEGKTRIILILLEDVTKHEKLSDELKAHMKMNTYLKWDDPRFYERLQRALPLRNNKKFILPDVFKQVGEKTVKSGLDVHLNSDGQLVNVAVKDAV